MTCPNLSSAAAFCHPRLLQANTGPQRIDSSGGAAPSSPMRVSLDCSGGSKGGSEWNSAGTFEEKDVSDWARRRLQVSRPFYSTTYSCLCIGPSIHADVYTNVLLYFTLTLTPLPPLLRPCWLASPCAVLEAQTSTSS